MFDNDLILASYARQHAEELRQIAAARALVVGERGTRSARPTLRVRAGRLLVRIGMRLATGRAAGSVSSITGRGRIVYDGYFSAR